MILLPDTVKIIAEVAERHGSSPRELCGRTGKKRLFDARLELILRLRAERGLSTTLIGRVLDGRDHTTIIHYLYRDKRLARQPPCGRRTGGANT
jgi:chromosomal replication initiation ATPase DnaA